MKNSTIITIIVGVIILFGFLFMGTDSSVDEHLTSDVSRKFFSFKRIGRRLSSIFGKETAPEISATGDYKLDRRRIFLNEANEYRKRAQYPHYSAPIPIIDGKVIDPIVEDSEIIPAKTVNPNFANGPFLYQYIERNNYEPGQTAIIHAFMEDERGKKFQTNELIAYLSAGGGIKGKILKKVNMYDNGGKGDKANDLIYTAAFETGNLKQKPHNYMIIIHYQIDMNNKESMNEGISATNSFTLGKLHLQTPTAYEDLIHMGKKGGELRIRINVKVEKTGHYYMRGSLYTKSGNPIEVAQNRQRLEKGDQWFELTWYGKAFCDMNENGPYTLKYLMMMYVDVMPGPRSQRLDNVHTTADYDVSNFTCESFDDELFIQKAEAIELEAEQASSEGR